MVHQGEAGEVKPQTAKQRWQQTAAQREVCRKKQQQEVKKNEAQDDDEVTCCFLNSQTSQGLLKPVFRSLPLSIKYTTVM